MVELTRSNRGFDILNHDAYPPGQFPPITMLAQQSSIVGDYEDAFDRPGSSALWIGRDHHLNREQVAEFVGYLQRWIETGKLREEATK